MDRYARQRSEIGEDGQKLLLGQHVLVVGIGALGSVASDLLARAGIGRLTLVDYDIVQEDNLQRQALYTTKDIGRHKVDAAAEHLQDINPDVEIRTLKEPFTAATPLSGVGCIIDGTDSLAARRLLNSRAKGSHIPLVIGSASGRRGLVFPVLQGGPCWECIIAAKRADDSCDDGILGTTTHLVATLQAAVAMRILLGERVPGELLAIDAWTPSHSAICVKSNPSCDTCAGRPPQSPFALELCQSRNRLHARPTSPITVDLCALQEVVHDYGTARRVRLEKGFALVHRHGLIEFENAPRDVAEAFASSIIEKEKEKIRPARA